VHFLIEIGRFAFWGPLWGTYAATYDDRLRLIGKRLVDCLLALIKLFSLRVTAEELRAIIGWKSAISFQWGAVDPKFHVEGVAPTNLSSSQKTRLNVLSYGIKIWTDLSSILSGITRVTDRRTDGRTDRQTDRILIARPRLHFMQRGKNYLRHSCKAFIGLTIFYAFMECRRGIAMRILSVHLSVCPSVKRVHCYKTEERYVQILHHTKDHLA